jgi:predicted nucleotide-binding protein (sugar kinase/HSP70/actin superfamily)
MEDIRSMLLADAAGIDAAMVCFENQWRLILDALEKKNLTGLMRQLDTSMDRLAAIPLKRPAEDVPKILLTGEIFVRRDSLSRRHITERLAENGFAVICSPVSEWIRYTDYMLGIDGYWQPLPMGQKIRFYIRQALMNRYEKRVIGSMTRSGLVTLEPVHMQAIIDHASPYISKNLSGEAVLTVGSSLAEVGEKVCGVIAIGPFGCMPNRLAESILSEAMTADSKLAVDPDDAKLKSALADMADLPFLAIESDGSPFPQLIAAKIEAFCQRALRLHQRMRQG